MKMIIRQELRTNLKPLLLWLVPLAIIHAAASLEFSVFQGDQNIADAMIQFDILFEALGSSVANMTTAEGFISLVSIYIYLPLTIYSGLLGSGIIAKEEKDKTAEYLFTLPVNRNQVIGAKMIVAFAYSILINLGVMATVMVTYSRFDVSDNFYQFIFHMSVGAFLTQVIFLCIGMLLSAVLKYYKKSGSITIAFLVSTYMLSILIGIIDGEVNVEFMKYLTPFQYFPSGEMLEGSFSLVFILIAIIISIISSYLTFYFYKKRDLYI